MGIEEIDKAIWKAHDDYVELIIHDENNNEISCTAQRRPKYCDRGHYQLNVFGQIELDSADGFPRYFFSFAELDVHARQFLKWRLYKFRTRESSYKCFRCGLVSFDRTDGDFLYCVNCHQFDN